MSLDHAALLPEAVGQVFGFKLDPESGIDASSRDGMVGRIRACMDHCRPESEKYLISGESVDNLMRESY